MERKKGLLGIPVPKLSLRGGGLVDKRRAKWWKNKWTLYEVNRVGDFEQIEALHIARKLDVLAQGVES